MSTIAGPGFAGEDARRALDGWRRSVFERVLGRGRATLFDLMDRIAAGQGRCGCPAHASLASELGHAAFYRALREGGLDPREALACSAALSGAAGAPRIYAVDTTAWPRPASATSPDRQPQYTPGGTRGAALIRTGWRFQQIARVTLTGDSWVVPVLTERIASQDDLVEATIGHIAAVCAADGATAEDPSLFLLDSGYPAARITLGLREKGAHADVLVRLSTSQTMWTRPEVRAAHPLGGRPRVHGMRLAMRDPDLPANAAISAPVDIYGTISVRAWTHVHPKIDRSTRGFEDRPGPLPVVEGTVLIADVQHLRPSRRAGQMALWYSGHRTDLITLIMIYLARYDVEHYFRYLKTTARAGDFRAQQPDAQQTWLRLHALAYINLMIARDLVPDPRLPWETRPQALLTPGQVRRSVSPALAAAWHPPARTKPSHPGPGRPSGKRRRRRQRHPVIRKSAIHKGK